MRTAKPLDLDLARLEQDNPLLDAMLADLQSRSIEAGSWTPSFNAAGEKEGDKSGAPVFSRHFSAVGDKVGTKGN